MFVNTSDESLFLDRDGKLVGAGPDARTLLVAPGGTLSAALARRHGVEGQLTPMADVTFEDAAGEEIVVTESGRAVAGHLAAPPPASQLIPKAGGIGIRRSQAGPAGPVEAKHVSQPQETKAAQAAAPAAAAPAPAGPTPGNLNVPPAGPAKK